MDISENNAITFEGTTKKNCTQEVGLGWYMDLFTNHSKPCSIGQKYSHCLANYSNSVVIGYPGRKLPRKLLTIVYTRRPPPKVSSFVLVSTTDRLLAAKENYKLWFEAILFVGRRTVLSTTLAWFSRKSAHIRPRTNSSS